MENLAVFSTKLQVVYSATFRVVSILTMLFGFETDQRKFGCLRSSLACLYSVLAHRHRSIYLQIDANFKHR